MKYSGSLVKKERENIFSLFLEREKIKFADVEKAIKIRSNMVAYHLKEMEKEGILKKRQEFYVLSEKGEKYLPIFSHVTGKELGPVPVILVAVICKDEILLIKRTKRPYANYWSMIGGKMKMHEDFDEASTRLVKEKTGIESEFVSLNAILHEKVMGEEIKHSFILFFTMVKVKNKKIGKDANLKWFKKKDISKEDTIPSDYYLIKNKLNKKTSIVSAEMKDDEGKLKEFKMRNVNKR
ncbi:MAG: NUDIX domain-containing protein [Candidatus Nanoarchaeia archaeon]